MSFVGIANNIWRATRGTGGISKVFPFTLPGFLSWIDYSDITTLFQTSDTSTPVTTNGQNIGRASDKSGNGNHFLEFSAATGPTYTTGEQNGLSGAVFPGARALFTNILNLGGTTLSSFCIIRATAGGNIRGLLFQATGEAEDFNNTSSGILMYYPSANNVNGFRNGNNLSSGSIPVANVYHQIGSVYDGVNHTIYVDNVAATAVANSDTFGATGTFGMGGRRSGGSTVDTLTGAILEKFTFTGVPTSAQRDQIAAYFTAKWAV